MLYKIVFYMIVVIWSFISLPQAVGRYKQSRERFDLFEIIARCLLAPSGIILLIAEMELIME